MVCSRLLSLGGGGTSEEQPVETQADKEEVGRQEGASEECKGPPRNACQSSEGGAVEKCS